MNERKFKLFNLTISMVILYISFLVDIKANRPSVSPAVDKLCQSCLEDNANATISENHCDTSDFQLFKTGCINCWQNRKVFCPRGAKKVTSGAGSRGCKYTVQVGEERLPARGCEHTCKQFVTVPRCCDGYWGQDCQTCPKDTRGSICSDKGSCFDGIEGNGTCACRGNLIGAVCEKCNHAQYYGPTCQSLCACLHGSCSNGINGTGECFCDDKYGGKLCDNYLRECTSLKCHQFASCLNITGKVDCHCNKGYSGDAKTSCDEINPCLTGTNTECHDNATCVHTGPDTSTCKCKENFSGDGFWCQAIDPCQTNNGGCDSNTTLCKYDGPGQSRCDCRYGFENYTEGTGCSLIDVCGKYEKTTCDPLASCETVVTMNVIVVKCDCPPGFLERNRVCYGDILSELDKLNSTGKFQNKLSSAVSFFRITYRAVLFNPSPLTIFVPTDDALAAYEPISSDPIWKVRARAHIVAGTINIDFSQNSAKTMYPILGYNYPIKCLKPGPSDDDSEDDDDAGSFASLNFNGKMIGNILVDGKLASNGVIYIIDTVLDPVDGQNLISNRSVINTISSTEELKIFTKFITKSYSFQRKLQETESYSLFAPTDEAMNSLSKDEYSFLTSNMGRSSLELLLQYNMFTNAIPMISLARTDVIRNLETINLNVSSDDGMITVGNEKAKILKSEITIKTKNVFIHIIDKLLIPEVIKPLVTNRCEKIVVKKFRGSCGDCSRSLCPTGSEQLNTENSQILTCVYKTEGRLEDGTMRVSSRIGCSRLCNVNVTVKACCPGFYGSTCRSCQGPTHEACNDNGICSDGERGTGLCNCNTNFNGTACDICTNSTKFGPQCTHDCLCQHGTCRNNIISHGECVPGSCLGNWTGENCDRENWKCKDNSTTCHQFATCLVSNNGTESCVCDAGYTGSGDECFEYNPCQDLHTSGCDLNAFCLHLGAGRTACECLPNYSGNGRNCTPVDPCASSDRGQCSKFAKCIFTGPGKRICECIEGYRGDGRACTEINICKENNGQCSQRAICTKTGPGTRSCACYEGYEGDGMICYGNILQEIAARPDLSHLQSLIKKWPSVKRLFMSLSSGFTCFLPTDVAWIELSSKDQTFYLNEKHITSLLKNHIIQEKLSSSKLRTLGGQTVQTYLQGNPLSINKVTVGTSDTSIEDGQLEKSDVPTIGKFNSKVTVTDLPVSSDGIVHIIDSVLEPPEDLFVDFPDLSAMVSTINDTKLKSYHITIEQLVSTGIIDQIEESGLPYTIFAVPDSANMKIPTEVPEKLADILRHHIILGKMIRVSDVKNGQHESSLRGPGYKLTLVRRHDTLIVNGENVVVPGIRTSKGIIHGLAKNFISPLPSRCDGSSVAYVKSTCLPCSYPNICPVKTTLVSKEHCLFRHNKGGGAIEASVGCQLICALRVDQPKCCPGFYGEGCDPCPGGAKNICFKAGSCADGIKGDGTCTCSSSKFNGTACELCADGRFGKTCDQECQCDKKNGVCNDGLQGDGTCQCKLGFRGKLCDQAVNSSDACHIHCHSAANCVPAIIGSESIAGSGFRCKCVVGYVGDGINCTAINSCNRKGFDSPCNENAYCTYLGPGVHSCVCKKGYEGDGLYCEFINPCLRGFGEKNCDENAACFLTGANSSICICNPSYEGDGKTCEPINPCKKYNGGCSENAICKPTGPNLRECKCKEDYVGNGVNCTGSIYSYISGKTEFEWFTLMDIFASLVPHTLNINGPIAAFLPSQATMMQLPTKLLTHEEPATQLYLNHIVGCANFDNLTGVTQLRTMAGEILNISKSDTGFKINNNISVLGEPMSFWNGKLYRIDIAMIPQSIYRTQNATDISKTKLIQIWQPNINNASNTTKPLYKNTKLLLDYNFHWVATLLKTSGDLPLLQNGIHNPWTLFLPTEEAFDSMPAQRLRTFISDPTYATEYIRYHMVRETFFTPSYISTRGKLKTIQGSDIRLSCRKDGTRYGEMIINEGAATIIGFDVFHITTGNNKEKKAAVYIIDKVLDPPSIGGRCDEVKNVTIKTDCGLCINQKINCPEGTQKIELAECRVSLSQANSVTVIGCQSVCGSYNITHKCCSYHYGVDCHPCPGGAHNSCSGNGKCSDGVNGNGACTCKEGFTGYACEKCVPSRYGRNCLPCQCTVHGACNAGINGDGTCFCDSDWTGPRCDQNRTASTVCKPQCHKNGYCVKSGTCFCKPGYRGDGRDSCEFMNMCEVYNGGCSIYATCSIVQERAVCKCLPNFIGDGTVCEGYNPCAASTTGCHPQARCLYVSANVSRCACNVGYKGDGVKQCSRQKPKNCAANNGGCSGNAICVDVPVKMPGDIPSTICTCRTGYVGDGFVCHGTVIDVISESVEMSGFYKKIRRMVGLRRKLGQSKLKHTVFVPSNINSRQLNFPAFRHVVAGKTIYYKEFSGMKAITMMSGESYPVVKNSSNHVFINGVVIKKTDIIATNGVIHLLESDITKRVVAVTTKQPSVSPNTPVLTPKQTKTTTQTTRSVPGKVTPKTATTKKTTTTKIISTTLKVVTVKPGGPIDGWKTTKPVPKTTPISTKTTTVLSNTPVSDESTSRRISSGIKIGISVFVIGLIVIVAGIVYWWKNRHTFVFRPFSESERIPSDPNEGDALGGLSNPAYDSTGFNMADDDDVILSAADEDTSFALHKDDGTFDNPGTS